MTEKNLIHSISITLNEMDEMDSNYYMSVNYTDGTEDYCEYLPSSKSIVEYERIKGDITYKVLSEDDRILYLKFINRYESIMMENIAFNINRVGFLFLDNSLLMETWYTGKPDDTWFSKVLYRRIIHEKGLFIDDYDKINERNSVIDTDVRKVSIEYRRILKDLRG